MRVCSGKSCFSLFDIPMVFDILFATRLSCVFQFICLFNVIPNKKMQHSCGVTYSIALSYHFQNTTILVNLFQLH